MSTVTIITSIIVLLAILVCYAFIVQTIRQKKQHHNRMLQAMRYRWRNFRYMLNGFPEGFLPPELKLLVQRSLLDTLENLVRLEPRNPAHKEELQLLTQQMSETTRQTQEPSRRSSVENPQQIRDIKSGLEELYKFVFQLEAKKSITPEHAEIYRNTIKHLVVQLSIDSYVLHGWAARTKGKNALALHYFELAMKLMEKERRPDQYEGRIQHLSTLIEEVRELSDEQVTNLTAKDAAPDEGAISSEWEEFAKSEKSWKKKQLYD